MPIRVLLTGKLQGPDMGGSILLIYKGGTYRVISPQTGFVPLDERIQMQREVEWEFLKKEVTLPESIAGVSH